MPLNNPATAGPTHQTNVTESRALDTVYQNTSGVPLYVAVSVDCQTSNPGEKARVILQSDSSNPPTTNIVAMGILSGVVGNPRDSHGGFMVVLPGNYYRANSNLDGGAAIVAITLWVEWY